MINSCIIKSELTHTTFNSKHLKKYLMNELYRPICKMCFVLNIQNSKQTV